MTRWWMLLLAAGCGDGERPSNDAAPAPPAPPPAADSRSWVVSAWEFGPVRTGWSVAQVNQALGDTLKPTYQVSDECDQLRPARFPGGVWLMIERDTVVRFDVDSAGIKTTEGAEVGSSEARLLELYGARAVVSPHKYTGPEGHYVTVRDSRDTTRFTVFETDGKTVERYRAGVAPAVHYIEGCA